MLKLLDNALSQGAKVDSLAAHLAARHARKLQEAVYKVPHPLASGLYPPEIVPAFIFEPIPVVFEKSASLNPLILLSGARSS